jgi:hypothetical protein
MSQRSPVRLLAILAIAATVALPVLGCGGGAAGTPANDDLIVTYFNMNGRTDVYRNQPLELRFSAPVKASSVSDRTIRLLTGTSLQTPVTAALIVDGNKVTIDPTRTQAQVDRSGPDAPMDHPFGYDALANFQLYIPGPPNLKTLTNLAGDSIRAEYVATFSTGENYLPELIQPKFVGVDGKGSLGFDPSPAAGSPIDPTDGQTEVPYDAHILLAFSEPMAIESMQVNKSVQVEDLDRQQPVTGGPLKVPGTLRPSVDGRTFSFVPSFSYGPGPDRMRVTLTQDITDLAGNPLETVVTRYFRTESKPGEVVTKSFTETFSNSFYRDPLNTTAEWNTTVEGRLQGGAITTSTVVIQYPADGVNSQHGGAGNNTFKPIDYPLVSENGNTACPSWPNGCRMQMSFTRDDVGEPGAITQIYWGPSSNALFAATHPSVKIRLGQTKDTAGVISSLFEDNFLGGLPLPNYDGIYDIPQKGDIDPANPQGGFWPYPTLTTPYEFDGTKGLLIDFQVKPAPDCQLLRYWFHGTGAGWPGYPGIRNAVATRFDATSDDFTGGGQPLVYDSELIKKRRTTVAQSRFYDSVTTAPDWGEPIVNPSSQPGGAQLSIEYQGATNPNDASTYTPWSTSVDIADNNRYIRFKMTLVSNLNSNTVARVDDIQFVFLSH